MLRYLLTLFQLACTNLVQYAFGPCGSSMKYLYPYQRLCQIHDSCVTDLRIARIAKVTARKCVINTIFDDQNDDGENKRGHKKHVCDHDGIQLELVVSQIS